MFDHILLPVDGSQLAECVLPHILPFAQTPHTRVTLLNVLDQFSTPYSSRPMDVVMYASCKIEAQAYLDEVSDHLSKAGVRVSTALTEGRAADGIIQYAHDHQVDLIALSSHGLSGFSGWNINSVVQKVALRAYTSLLIIPAYQAVNPELEDFRYRKIFVGLDGSLRTECVLPIAKEIAARHHTSLLLVNVAPRPELPSHLPLNPAEVEMVDRIVERNRRFADEYLKEICARFSTDQYDIQSMVVDFENPIDTLHELVDQESADLVVLCAHGSSGSCNRPYGSVTLSFIAYGTTPLLILQDIPSDRIVRNKAELAASERPRILLKSYEPDWRYAGD
jgi:nucleotide-binding universal stress UspA family protein